MPAICSAPHPLSCLPTAYPMQRYMDRKKEVPPGKRPYFVLPVLNWHEVSCARHITLQPGRGALAAAEGPSGACWPPLRGSEMHPLCPTDTLLGPAVGQPGCFLERFVLPAASQAVSWRGARADAPAGGGDPRLERDRQQVRRMGSRGQLGATGTRDGGAGCIPCRGCAHTLQRLLAAC